MGNFWDLTYHNDSCRILTLWTFSLFDIIDIFMGCLFVLTEVNKQQSKLQQVSKSIDWGRRVLFHHIQKLQKIPNAS